MMLMSKKNKGTVTGIKGPEYRISFTEQLLYSIVVLTIEALLLVASAIFRLLLTLFLKIRHGSKFGGFVMGGDAIWFSETDSSPVNHIMFLFDSKMQSADEFNSYVIDSTKQILWHQNHPYTHLKLTSTVRAIAGYVYYLKHSLKIAECHTTLSVDAKYVEKPALTDILSQCSMRPLPKNNTALWELITLNKPLRTDTVRSGMFTYVVIFRLHHSVADGISAAYFLARNFTNEQSAIHGYTSKLMGTLSNRRINIERPGILNMINNVLKFLYVVAISASVNLKERRRFKYEENCLHGPKLSGQKYLVYAAEHSEERLVQTVKKLKRGIPGSTFSAILLTAVSRAIRRYCDVHCQQTPKSIVALLPVPVSVPNINAKIKVGNSLSYKIFDLPILGAKKTVQEHLSAVVEGMQDVYNRTDVMVKYFLSNGFIGNLPIPMMGRTFVSARKATICFSSIPGFLIDTMCNQKLKEAYVFPVNFANIGLTFNTTTHNGKLTFSLNVDRALIPVKQAAQDLIDNVVEEIRLMYDEFRNTSMDNSEI